MGRTVGTLNDLARDVGEVKLLWEMATEAGDESLSAEIEQGLQRSATALEAFEVKMVLSGPQDRKNAILWIWSRRRRPGNICRRRSRRGASKTSHGSS